MDRLSSLSKTLISIILLLVGAYFILFMKWNIFTFIISGFCFLALIWVLVYFSRKAKRKIKHNQKIIHNERKVNARILGVKDDKPGIIILQLKIESGTKEYITSTVIHKTHATKAAEYEVGNVIKVYINPKDRNDIIFPESNKGEKVIKKKFDWLSLIYLPFLLCGFGIPIYLIFFDTAEKKFMDINYISVTNTPGDIWELKFQPPKKLYINIYEPFSKEKIKTIKDKKEEELNNSMDFFISQQGQKVFIVGTGNTPVMDIYNAITYQKLSDIKKFEQSQKKLKEGISRIEHRPGYYGINKEDVILITTNDGERIYYNIPQDKYYRNENDLKEDIEESNYERMSQQMFAFVFSVSQTNYNRHQLNVIESNNQKSIQTLLKLSGTMNLNTNYFKQYKKQYYKYCKLIPISGNKYFFESQFLYIDSTMAIIEYYPSMKKDVEELITGIDRSGKVLFDIKQSDFPGIESFRKNTFKPRHYNKLKVIRDKDKIIILFDVYGALCVDVKTGKIIWKFER